MVDRAPGGTFAKPLDPGDDEVCPPDATHLPSCAWERG